MSCPDGSRVREKAFTCSGCGGNLLPSWRCLKCQRGEHNIDWRARAEKAEAALAIDPSPRHFCRIEVAEQWQERAKKAEAELAHANERITGLVEDALRRSKQLTEVTLNAAKNVLACVARAEAAEKRAAELEKWVAQDAHLEECAVYLAAGAHDAECTCGLSALLAKPTP